MQTPRRRSTAGGRRDPEHRRHTVLEHRYVEHAGCREHPHGFVRVIVVRVPMAVAVAMPVMVAVVVPVMPAAQQPHARQVDRETEHRDRNRLAKMDRDRRQQPRNRLVADQDRDHREHDRAREPGQAPSLPVPNTKRGSSACLRA